MRGFGAGGDLQFEQLRKAFKQLSFKQIHEHRERESHEEAQEKNGPDECSSVWEREGLGVGSERRPGVRSHRRCGLLVVPWVSFQERENVGSFEERSGVI